EDVRKRARLLGMEAAGPEGDQERLPGRDARREGYPTRSKIAWGPEAWLAGQVDAQPVAPGRPAPQTREQLEDQRAERERAQEGQGGHRAPPASWCDRVVLIAMAPVDRRSTARSWPAGR